MFMMDVFYLYLFRHVYMQQVIVHSGLKTNCKDYGLSDKYILKFLIWQYTSVAWYCIFLYWSADTNFRVESCIFEVETNLFKLLFTDRKIFCAEEFAANL